MDKRLKTGFVPKGINLIEQCNEIAASRDSRIPASAAGNLPEESAEASVCVPERKLPRIIAFAATTGDQALVSLSNFGVTIVVGRILGPEGFGIFTLVWSVALFLNVVQQSFFVAPMLTLSSKYEGNERSKYFGSVLALQSAFAISSMILLVLGFEIGVLGDFFSPKVNQTILPLACACFFYQMQEFIRRMLQATARSVAALLCDVTTYGLQIAMLSWLLLNKQAGMASIFWMLAATWMAGCVFFVTVRGQIEFSKAAVTMAMGVHFSFGGSLALANLFMWFSGYGSLYAVAAQLSPAAVGNIRAAMNVVAPFNVLAVGIQIFLSIEAAQVYRLHGMQAMTRLLRNYAVGFMLVCVPLGLVLWIWARPLVRALLGSRFEVPASWLVGQFVAVVAFALFGFLMVHFKTIERNYYTALAAGGGMLLTLTLTTMLVRPLGAGAVFVGLVAGQTGAIACAGWFWLKSIRGQELG